MEPGNGDSYRYQGGTVDGDISPDFHLCNRGKLSIVLDSRNEAVTQCPARYIAHAKLPLLAVHHALLASCGSPPVWVAGARGVQEIARLR